MRPFKNFTYLTKLSHAEGKWHAYYTEAFYLLFPFRLDDSLATGLTMKLSGMANHFPFIQKTMNRPCSKKILLNISTLVILLRNPFYCFIVN